MSLKSHWDTLILNCEGNEAFAKVLPASRRQNNYGGFRPVLSARRQQHALVRASWSRKVKWLAFVAALFAAANLPAANPSAVADSITFGAAMSERMHGLAENNSEIIAGGLGEPARILSPLSDGAWEGGRLAFTLKVDPDKQNYATVRLWGSDATDDQLVLFCDGKQVGYRHLGDIDILDIGGGEAPFPGRFIYETAPLPLEMTRGRTNLDFEIRSYGPTWAYGSTFARFQKPMDVPTRGIYELYTHTNVFFAPPADEKQGVASTNPPVRRVRPR